MQNVSVSRRYARALLDASGAKSDELLAQVEELVRFLGEHPDVATAVGSPALTKPVRMKAVEAVAKVAGFLPQLTNLLKLLTDRNRIGILPTMARIYRELVDARLGRVRGKVTSAVKLGDAQVSSIRASLETLTRKSVLLETKVDASLIGGVVTQVGSHTYDGSLKTQLRDLGQQLSRPAR